MIYNSIYQSKIHNQAKINKIKSEKTEMRVEHLVQINEDNNIEQTIARYLTNSESEAQTIVSIHINYEVEVEKNYNDTYQYCVSVFFPEDSVLDEI